MMNWTELCRLRDELERYTYRPDWKLEIVAPGAGGPVLGYYSVRVTGRVLDAYDPTKTVQVTSLQAIPWAFCEFTDQLRFDWRDEFGQWLQRALFDVERHESQEWLRRDGELYDDPHKEKETRRG